MIAIPHGRWADFIEMSAISISNAVDRSDVGSKREKQYLEIIGEYRPEEQKVFPQLLEIMVSAMEANQDQDFLGELFMALELSSHWKGQFFTPYCACRMMAEMQCQDAKEKFEQKGWISVYDPTCGAGLCSLRPETYSLPTVFHLTEQFLSRRTLTVWHG